MTSTPMNPAITAVHRRQPMRSASMTGASATMMSGAVKLMALTVASGSSLKLQIIRKVAATKKNARHACPSGCRGRSSVTACGPQTAASRTRMMIPRRQMIWPTGKVADNHFAVASPAASRVQLTSIKAMPALGLRAAFKAESRFGAGRARSPEPSASILAFIVPPRPVMRRCRRSAPPERLLPARP